MSLCILLRTPDGGALMAADTAVSTVYEGVPYRVQNEIDDEKIIVHLGHLIFCSGNLERCRVLRTYMRSLEHIAYEAISDFAQKLWGGDASDTSTGLLICQPDNKLIGMLSAQNFAVTELPWDKGRLDIQALGFRMQEAYKIACSATEKAEDWRDTVLSTYAAVACEEVGGQINVFTRRVGKEIKCMTVPIPEQRPVRRGVFVPLDRAPVGFHAIVQASQFLDKNGNDMFTQEGKISGEYLDLRGVNIINAAGETMITIDENGIRFGPSYSPVQVRYSTNKNAAWPSGWVSEWNDSWSNSTTTEVYAKYSYDGGETWTSPALAQGKNGATGSPGSDATVPKYITDTVISKGVIEAPRINAASFGIYPPNRESNGSLSLFGDWNGEQMEMFKLSYFAGDEPRVVFDSPRLAPASWNFPNSTFRGNINFSEANVRGLEVLFS